MGELRERRRLALPLILAGIGGMLVPVAIYLADQRRHGRSAHGWGVAMSTDTAFALGMLALVGRELPARLRAFLLTVTVVDDLVALVVIAVFYSETVALPALLIGVGIFGVVLGCARGGIRPGPLYVLLGVALLGGAVRGGRRAGRGRPGDGPAHLRLPGRRATTWSAPATCSASSASSRRPSWPGRRAQRAGRRDLAQRAPAAALPPVDQLRHRAAVRARQRRRRHRRAVLARAFTSPITLGILVGYVVGKPIGIAGFRVAGDPR